MINRQNSPLFAIGRSKWDAFVAAYEGPYDFSASIYAGMNRKITFLCPLHGEVTADAKVLMRGGECQACSFAKRKGKTRLTQKKILARFFEVHGHKYDYQHVKYLGQQVPVEIVCRTHGKFKQKPEYHWCGAGCSKCFHVDRRGASQRYTLATFTVKLEQVFPGAFTVITSEYVNSQANITVRCNTHHVECDTKPNWLLNGYNPCTQCNHMKSRGEEEVARYLSIFTPIAQRDRIVIKPRELDIYIPERKLAVEYCGMYWHSHHDAASEKKDKHKHYEKYTACKAAGVRLLTIYESEWQDECTQKALKRLLRNALNKSKGKLMARKCELAKIDNAQARAFYGKYHPQGGSGSGEHYALMWKGKVVACMRFTFGSNDRGAGAKTATWTLSRYATRITVAGAASRLFKAFLAEVKPAQVKSFSDNRYFDGGMYEQLGFTLEDNVAPDYQVWSPKLGLRPKPHYQRRSLSKRLADHGIDDVFDPETDPRTEREMVYLMGAARIYDCGKKRWVWTPPLPSVINNHPG